MNKFSTLLALSFLFAFVLVNPASANKENKHDAKGYQEHICKKLAAARGILDTAHCKQNINNYCAAQWPQERGSIGKWGGYPDAFHGLNEVIEQDFCNSLEPVVCAEVATTLAATTAATEAN